MKKYNYIKGIFAALILTSPLASAESDYPAADFQPKVLFNDSDYQHNQSKGTSSSSASQNRTEADPNYPAATFEPKVLYKDDSYKPSKSQAKASTSRPSVSTNEQTASSGTEEIQADDSMQTYLIGLVILALVGGVIFKKYSETKPKPKARPRPRARAAAPAANDSGALTGVARYLNEKMPAVTGVAKYLEGRENAPTSGVAKYVAKQVIKSRKAAASKVTGVEKYLRDRG